ncbi:trigger factor-like protein TIG, Chloroplastic isoform X2 [Asparagus officinalis]|uniref:trigger factor-like protein TIG, Chloroplastic isoform X2 n=1 Tax=Asparagus officinalis TaxID=4686 RepID=UPI00098E0234|nr:trigger factor-like protein TIG, Chloroplastic isoform X2 [Asparagus officinalis]
MLELACRVADEARLNQVPEFCPGKRIPENILINYVGKQNVQGATIEAILKKTLPHAVSSVNLVHALFTYCGLALSNNLQIMYINGDLLAKQRILFCFNERGILVM